MVEFDPTSEEFMSKPLAERLALHNQRNRQACDAIMTKVGFDPKTGRPIKENNQ